MSEAPDLQSHIYLKRLGGLLLFGLILVSAINFVIDPFGMFAHQMGGHWTVGKPTAESQQRWVKPYELKQLKPQTLILGSSTCSAGINPRDPVFTLLPVYNFCLDNANIKEFAVAFDFALQLAPIKLLIISLDFMVFNSNRPLHPHFHQERLQALTKQRFWWKDLWLGLASMDALFASASTLVRQDWPMVYHAELAHGFMETAYRRRLTHTSVLAYSRLAEEGHARDEWKGLELNDAGPSEPIQQLQRILQRAKEHHVQVQIMLPPMHMRILKKIQEKGLWSRFVKSKSELLGLVREHCREAKPDCVSIWDFTGAYQANMEVFPPADAVGVPALGYWDALHYRENLGSIALQRMLSANQESADFGVRLQDVNVDEHMQKMAAAVSSFMPQP